MDAEARGAEELQTARDSATEERRRGERRRGERDGPGQGTAEPSAPSSAWTVMKPTVLFPSQERRPAAPVG